MLFVVVAGKEGGPHLGVINMNNMNNMNKEKKDYQLTIMIM